MTVAVAYRRRPATGFPVFGGARPMTAGGRDGWPVASLPQGIVAGPPASSGGLGMLARAAWRRCWWYDLAGERAGAGDHDQLPVAGAADCEGFVVCFLKNAQDVGHLLAACWAGPPADHDPLADVGGGEPDLKPVAQAGHLSRGGAPCALGGRAMAPAPAREDVAGDIFGVVRQRAGFGGAAGGAELVEELGVLNGELRPLVGHVVFVEDRLDRADRLAGAAVDALVGVDVEHPLAFVDAVDRAFLDAALVLDVDARLGDHIRHGRSASLGVLPAPGGAVRGRASLLAGRPSR